MTSALINGREATLPDDPDALLVDVLRDGLASDRDQARLRRRRLRRLHGASRRRSGRRAASCRRKPPRARASPPSKASAPPNCIPVQRAFMALDALQCGFCTPGFIVEASAFHDAWRAARGAATPTREEIARALSGHLCRCGAYDNIFRAVADACSGKYDGDAGKLAARRSAPESDRRRGLHRRYSPRGAARRRGPALAARPRPGRENRSRAGARCARRRRGHLPPRRRPHGPVRRRADRRGRRGRSKDRARRFAAIKVDYEILPSVIGPEAARKPDAPILFPRGKGQKVQRRRRRGRAGLMVRQCPRPDRRVLAQEKVGARRDREAPARRAIRCCSKGRSGPGSSSIPVSSRMRRSRDSTATN